MNCDQAFDYLTDSARRDSISLARHLAGCPRCRQLKDTLEPALDLFDELVPEPAIGSLDGASRASRDDSVRIAEQSAARLSNQPILTASRFRTSVRYAAACLIGAALIYGLTMPGGSAEDPVPAGSICPWKNRTATGDHSVNAEAVILSCVNCHQVDSSKSTGNVSGLNLDALRRSFSLAIQSRDSLAVAHLRDRNLLLACASI